MTATNPEWYYVGHYGQLGPLTLEQMEELARDGVIDRETYVWRPGMDNWCMAQDAEPLRAVVMSMAQQPPPAPGPGSMPPPSPLGSPPPFRGPSVAPPYPVISAPQTAAAPYGSQSWSYLSTQLPKSDKNRLAAGLLNLIPGVGRFYLGYAAHGALQLITAFFCGVGFIWAWIDAVYMLAGGVKYDGYGRRLDDTQL